MTIKKTYPKIVLLIYSSSIFFIFLFSALYYHTIKVEKQVYLNSQEQFYNETVKLLTLDRKPIEVATNNDTNWDEFVNFIKVNNVKWYDETIGNEIDIYKVDYFGTYGLDKKYIIHAASNKIKSTDFINKDAMKALSSGGMSHFYMKIPEGVVEVIGASIHPSKDLLKKTKPSGYFFAVRLLDTEFLKHLQELTNSDVRFLNSKEEVPISKYIIYSVIPLKDNRGGVVKTLLFKRNFGVYFENSTEILYIIIFAFFVNLVMNLILTRIWVYYPLNLITKVLETGSMNTIQQLKATSGEFRYIGNLFEENKNQKTELVKAKLKAEEGERLKASFLANLSHEIRTPMNAINGFTDLILNTELQKEELQEFLNIIDKSGKNLVLIIDDLIEMSKIDSNQIVPNYTEINLETCLKELHEVIKITIPKSKNIDFYIIQNPYPVAFDVVTDVIKLKQIIINLITNAIKFTEEGYVAFGYTVDEEKSEIVFTIKDTGIGIDEDEHDYIFDRFKRVENDASIIAGGLGLGLAISKAYVTMLGGTIQLQSKISKGSVFTFTIPLNFNEVNAITVQSISDRACVVGEKKLKILIAEDDNINFILFQKIMQPTGYEILRANNGLEAVNICISHSDIDIVLMDIKMPIMDGFEAFEKIRAIRPALIIIAQTAYSSEEDKDLIEKAGFSGYLKKPIDRKKLMNQINQIF